jgi:serine/threonine-protein kinase RsbW
MKSSDPSASSKSKKTDAPKKVVIKVPSDTRHLRKVSIEIEKSLASYKLDEASLFDIRLCVEEAVRNAMVHGNRSDKDLHVEVSCWVKNGKLNIVVEDKGPGFDHTNVPDPTNNENLLKTSGRGVCLIRRLMDRAEYNGSGNKLTMVKTLKPEMNRR